VSLTVVAAAATFAALTSAVLAGASWRALLRTGNADIGWFVAAFGVLALKNAAKAYRALADVPESTLVESAFSIADLLAVALIAWPLIARRRGP